MNFNIRPITDEDIVDIARWFDQIKWPMPPADGIGARIGVIAEKNGVKYASLYSYLTGTSAAFLEWVGLNPDVPIDQSREALSEIVQHFMKMCELSEPKVRVLTLTTKSETIAAVFKSNGFRIESQYHKVSWMLKE